MSGIVGIIQPANRPIDPPQLDAMLRRIAHRGTDSSGTWIAGGVGLGQQTLWHRDEAVAWQYPFQQQGLAIVADVRLDNRTELIARLSLADQSERAISDHALILAAYTRWGENCPAYLLGDFSFALWDQLQQVLFCARDHMGVKPFHYVHTATLFAFASELKALLAISSISPRINEQRLVHYLLQDFSDQTITSYEGIYRLPPAHSLTLKDGRIKQRRYWLLPRPEVPATGTAESLTARYLELLTEAVRCRLPASHHIGTELSGGMDSSAVTALARKLLPTSIDLPTFSLVFPHDPASDERHYIEALFNAPAHGYSPVYVGNGFASTFRHSADILRQLDDAVAAFHGSGVWQLYRTAQQRGVRVILSGTDGDSTVSHGFGTLIEQADRGEWAAFAAFAHSMASALDSYQHADRGLLYRYGLPYLREQVTGLRWRRAARGISTISRHFAIPLHQLLLKYVAYPLLPATMRQRLEQWRRIRQDSVIRLLNPDFARRVRFAELQRHVAARQQQLPHTEIERHWQHLNDGGITDSLEQAEKMAAAFGIELRHPFFDRRLLEFCLSLPNALKFDGQHTRAIAHRGMHGILPERINARRGKANLSTYFDRCFSTYDQPIIQHWLVEHTGTLGDYLNLSSISALLEYNRAMPNSGVVQQLWMFAMLSQWLQLNAIQM